jgi:hypothetical protein
MNKKEKLEEIFTSVYQKNLWGDDSSVSGPGSSLEQTREIRERIIELFARYNIKSIVDAPCGDFFWMKEVLKRSINNIDSYTGVDIVEELILNNQTKYGSDKIKFLNLDLTHQRVPKADLIICRDCFLHLSYKNIYNILSNFKLSGTEYLLISTYTRHKNKNVYKFSVEGRAINVEKYPFQYKNTLVSINEEYHGQNDEFNDKSLNLLKLNTIDLKGMYCRILLNEIFFTPGFIFLNPLKRGFQNIHRLIRRFL